MNGIFRLIAFLMLTIFISCDSNTETKAKDIKAQSNKRSFDRDSLNHYFEDHEIKPSIVVNNNKGTQTEVQLLNHQIKWLYSDVETKIKIKNDLFSLSNKVTLNIVWENKDTVDFANNWDEIKLYKINSRELIGIKMSYQPCTGLGCDVHYFLIYDLQTQSKNYFGTFRTDDKLALYNFNNDDKIDYLSKTFSGGAHGSTPMEFIYELFSMDSNGQFVQQINNNGQVYQIKQTTFPNDTTKSETFEIKWMTELK